MNKNAFLKIFLLSFIWFIYVYLLFLFENMYYADVFFNRAQHKAEIRDFDEALRLADLAVEKNPNEPNYYRGRAKINVLDIVLNDERSQTEKVHQKIYALKDLRTAINLNPNNLVTIRNEIPLYYYLSINDYSKISTNFEDRYKNTDYAILQTAQDFFATNKNKFGHDVGVVTLIADYEKKLGLQRQYEESVEVVKSLRPDLLDWYKVFAN